MQLASGYFGALIKQSEGAPAWLIPWRHPAVAAYVPVHRDGSAPQGYGHGEENQSFTTVYQCWNLLFGKFCQLDLKFISTVCSRKLHSLLAAVLAWAGGQAPQFNYFYSSCHCWLHPNWSPMSCLLSRTSGYPFQLHDLSCTISQVSAVLWSYPKPGQPFSPPAP